MKRKNSTKTLRLLLLTFLVLTGTMARAGFTPVAVTGYTQDVVANGVGAATTSTTADVDGVNYVFLAEDFAAVAGNAAPTYFLPTGGVVNSVQTSGLTYQLESYSSNNALRLAAINSTGTLTFTTPATAGEVYVLGVTGSGISTADIVVNFTDLTSETFPAVEFPDWYGGSGFAIQGIGRVKLTDNTLEGNAGDPRLYERKLTLSSGNYSKDIASVTITKTVSAGVLIVMGITTNDVCNGTPVAGSAQSTVSTVCPNTTFTLSLTGNTNSAGLGYQWESSDAGVGNWVAISGATDATYEVTNQTVATDYRATLTCNNGGANDISALVSVAENGVTSCYCAPYYLYGGTGDYIANVTFETLNNSSTGNPAPYYVDYTSQQPATIAIPDVMQGITYNMSLTFGPDGNQFHGVWIDYDQNGVFDASEFTTSGANNTSGGTAPTIVPITIPLGATPGQTRMRIRGGNDNQPADIAACGASGSNYGEGEDYLVNIVATSACAGTPVGGTAGGPTGICLGDNVNLTLTGYTLATGIEIQWESSASGSGTWSPISGATTASYTVTGQTSDMDYHAVVTCTNGGAFDVSTVVTVTMNNFLFCYCASGAYYIYDGEITNVTVATLNNSSTCSAGNQQYSDYTATVPSLSLTQTGTYPVSVMAGSCGGSYDAYVKIFIDYDQDGTFNGSNEEAYAGVPPGGQYTPAGVAATGSIIVPLAATPGTTRMRVILNQTTNANDVTPCGTYNYGETEDYLVDIVAAPACSGNPVAGTASGPAGICAGEDVNLILTGYTIGTGISIQWEESPAGAGSWTPIAGATTIAWTVTGQSADMDYHAVITCANGGNTDVSNDITVSMNSFLFCYCASGAYYDADGEITNVTVGTLNNSSTCSSSDQLYTDYAPTVAPLSLTQTATYPVSVMAGSCGGSYAAYVKIFIDYDQDGTFNGSNEEVYAGVPPGGLYTPAGVAATGSITVPLAATPGTTRMRVILDQTTNPGDVIPCGTYNYGETEDYLVDIVAAVACSGNPVAGTASSDISTLCYAQTGDVTLTLSGYTIGTGIEVQWESSPTGAASWTPIAGATSPVSVVSQTGSTDYHAVVTCTNGGNQDVSNEITVGENAPVALPFTETFETSSTTRDCWTVINANGDADAWHLDYTDYPNNGAMHAGLYTDYNAGANDDWLIMPAVNLTGNQRLKYWSRVRSGGEPNDYEILVSTTGSSPADFTNVLQPLTSASNTTYAETVLDLSAFTGTTFIAFHVPPGGLDGWYLYFDDVTIEDQPSCIEPSTASLAAANITTSSADLSWGAVTGASAYEYAVTTSSTPPASGTSISGTSVTASPLNGSTTYYLHVRTDCGGGDYSVWSTISFMTALVNDDAPGAVTLVPGAGCTGAAYSNVGSSQSASEPFTSCRGTSGNRTVWFKFVAPASGAIRATTDFSGGTLTDTRIALFSAVDVNDYATFNIISCDDDNGINGNTSTVFATDLTAGDTYYILVDNYSGTTEGTFCVAVDELNSSMLASSGTCSNGQGTYGMNDDYHGWVTLSDNNGKLIALAQNTTGSAGSTTNYDPYAVTINSSGTVRADGSVYYLDRNYHITNDAVPGPVNVQFFFTAAELAALQGVDPGATLSNLNVTHQSGAICQADFNSANGAGSLLTQAASGSVNGADWITVSTPGFSNFYIMGGNVVLNINLKNISAANVGERNRVDWTTATEDKGDYFIVERSADGRNFSSIGDVTAKGKASGYSFWDQAPVAGINYYRLKLMSASGSSSYSKVVTATVKSTNSFVVEAYPNPITDQVTVTAYGQQGANASISICDVTGKVLRVIDVTGSTATVNMSSMASGLYLIKYSDSNHTETIKVNKQ